MKLYTKEQLIADIRHVAAEGWHRSVKTTINRRNDGAVGNTLESLLGIEENNLPIPNASEWELKGQRSLSSSLITLKHIEPSPRAARIVSDILLPKYGWNHKEAGRKYPSSEMSFRSTTSATSSTKRGFSIKVDESEKKIRFVFDHKEADITDLEIVQWLQSVDQRTGLGPLQPEPYWGFDDLWHAIGSKILNCFYVTAESKEEDGHEWFRYVSLEILSGFSFGRFIDCVREGAVLVDFDARTGHNHGTKFRLRQGYWQKLYNSVDKVF